jgi:hypothetical protein
MSDPDPETVALADKVLAVLRTFKTDKPSGPISPPSSTDEVDTRAKALTIINSTDPTTVDMKKALQRLSRIARYSGPEGDGSLKDHPDADAGLANLINDDTGIKGASPGDEATIKAELVKVMPSLAGESAALAKVYAFLNSFAKADADAILNMITKDDAITGGRRRRKSRKARKSRKSRWSRRSRRARRSRRSRRSRRARMMV